MSLHLSRTMQPYFPMDKNPSMMYACLTNGRNPETSGMFADLKQECGSGSAIGHRFCGGKIERE